MVQKNSKATTHEIGLKKPNSFGIFDMSGNVWEWCWDWCWDWYGLYTETKKINLTGPTSGSMKVYRGGSFLDFDYGCTVSIRGKRKPTLKQIDIGFRVVTGFWGGNAPRLPGRCSKKTVPAVADHRVVT